MYFSTIGEYSIEKGQNFKHKGIWQRHQTTRIWDEFIFQWWPWLIRSCWERLANKVCQVCSKSLGGLGGAEWDVWSISYQMKNVFLVPSFCSDHTVYSRVSHFLIFPNLFPAHGTTYSNFDHELGHNSYLFLIYWQKMC